RSSRRLVHLVVLLLLIVQRLEDGGSLDSRGVAQTVNRAAFGDSRQPRARILWDAVGVPAAQRDHDSVLQRILGKIEAAKLTDQRRQHPPVFLPKRRLDESASLHPQVL